MKKKGFTLIELLAVIVILAIIALIATPLVLKYIEKSRKESKVDSAYSFIRNLETEIANYSIEHNGTKYTTDKENIKDLDLNTSVKGENPTDGKVCISNVGQIEKGVFEYNNYYVSYDGKKVNTSDKDTFDNFKCDNDTVVFDDEIEITFYEDMWAYAPSKCLDQTKFKHNANYKMTIGDNEVYDVIGSFGKYSGEDGFGLSNKYEISYIQVENNCLIFSMNGNLKLDDREHIKIEYINDDIYPHYLTIRPDALTIFSLELEVGSAIVEIIDNNGNSSIFDAEVKNGDIYKIIRIRNSNTNYEASKIIQPYYELVKKWWNGYSNCYARR